MQCGQTFWYLPPHASHRKVLEAQSGILLTTGQCDQDHGRLHQE